ncbi:hypothetical protein BGZ83_010092 [Gryganskiella cystojenkinii]|nr:hypothetical protein BGZ83_010092 [Gryganskiella cystojenkinii]
MHPPNGPNSTDSTSACNGISNDNNQSQDMIDSSRPLHRPFDAVPSEIITVILSHVRNEARPRLTRDGKYKRRPSLRHLCSCLYVSKLFYSLSKPVLWRDFHMITGRLHVPAETMRQNWNLVRTLVTAFNCAPSREELNNTLIFPHLTGLTLTVFDDTRNWLDVDMYKTFAGLIRRHRQTLETLKVFHISISYKHTQFWKEVATYMHLAKRIKRLEIENSTTGGYENLKAISDLCNLSSLQELHLTSVELYSYISSAGANENMVTASTDPLLYQETCLSSEPCRLRHLTIERAFGDQAFFDRLVHRFRYCPDLSSVVWGNSSFSFVARGLIDRTIQWPSLRKLDLRWRSLSEDEITAGILNALTKGLEELAIRVGIFESPALQALQDKHAVTLRRLDLYGSSATSATIHSILCTCPRLVFIRADRLFFTLSGTVPDDRPWVCKDLQEWHVVIELESSYDIVCPDFDDSSYLEEQMDQEKEISRKIFGRLAALNRISILDLGLDRSLGGHLYLDGLTRDECSRLRGQDSRPPLQLRLDWGLSQLETLTDLVVLNFDKEDQLLGEDERRWFESMCPKLKL